MDSWVADLILMQYWIYFSCAKFGYKPSNKRHRSYSPTSSFLSLTLPSVVRTPLLLDHGHLRKQENPHPVTAWKGLCRNGCCLRRWRRRCLRLRPSCFVVTLQLFPDWCLTRNLWRCFSAIEYFQLDWAHRQITQHYQAHCSFWVCLSSSSLSDEGRPRRSYSRSEDPSVLMSTSSRSFPCSRRPLNKCSEDHSVTVLLQVVSNWNLQMNDRQMNQQWISARGTHWKVVSHLDRCYSLDSALSQVLNSNCCSAI